MTKKIQFTNRAKEQIEKIIKKDQIKKGKTYIDPTSPKYRIAGKDVYVEQMSDKEIKEEFIKLIQPKALDKHKFEAVINFCKLNGVEEWIIRYSGSGDDGCIDECILDEKHKKLKMNKNLNKLRVIHIHQYHSLFLLIQISL